MSDEKKEEKKGYTFLDKRGKDQEAAEVQPEFKKPEPEQRPEHRVKPDSHPYEQQARGGTPPAIDFTTLIMSFASAAMISTGRVADPATGGIHKNLAIAQQNIDIITLLHEKTRGNLTAEEERLMDQILYELRMAFLDAVKEGR